MGVEVYKFEIGHVTPGGSRLWTFYFSLYNSSGRDQVQVSRDILDNLNAFHDWLWAFPRLWLEGWYCRRLRIRRIDPQVDPWNDYTTEFATLTGFIPYDGHLHNVRMRVAWHTSINKPANTCTYLDGLPYGDIVNNQWTDDQLFIAERWASLHDTMRVTTAGDPFQPCIRIAPGNYFNVIGHWVDRRPVLSRRHLWKG